MADARDEMVKLVQEKAGIDATQAEMAVAAVVGFMKEKLPEPLASNLDTVLNQDIDPDMINSVMGQLGGLFGGDKK